MVRMLVVNGQLTRDGRLIALAETMKAEREQEMEQRRSLLPSRRVSTQEDNDCTSTLSQTKTNSDS